MKYFAIDQGNTLTKLAVFENGQISEVTRFKEANPEVEISDFLTSRQITHGIISTVRANGLKLHSPEIKVLSLDHNTKLFFSLQYETKKTLGLDRIANTAAVIRLATNDNYLIIDFGTCTTYSLVLNGIFVGGAISPGLDMRYKSLKDYTSGLPRIEMSEILHSNVIGNSTDTSIKAGVEAAGLLEIDAMIEKYCSLYADLSVIVTGGNLRFFESHLKSTIFAVPNLTLLGLYEIYKYNEF